MELNMFAVRFRILWLGFLVCLLAAPAMADHDRRRHRDSDRGRDRGYERPPVGYGGYGRTPRPAGYIELEAGSTLIPDQDVQGAVNDGELDLDSGFTVGGAAGLRFSPYLRLEGALNYRRAEVDTFDFDGPFVTDSQGDVGVFSTMANVYFDLPLPNTPATPFIGAGLGFAVLDIDTYDRFNEVNIEDSSVQFAWNLTAGVAWAVTQNLDVVTRYRYFATEDASANASGLSTLPGSADVEFSSHEAVLGLRFNF